MEKGCTKKGFTLIELLVVIAIISLLMAVIVPSLKLAKQKAASIVCMANVKNMALGWFSYKEDNDSWIMSSCYANNNTAKNAPGTTDPDAAQWVGQPRDAAGNLLGPTDLTPVTDEDEKRGIEAGALYDYLEAFDVYNCPSDKVKSDFDTVDPEKFVTYAIPDCLAGEHGKGPNTWANKDNRILKFDQITSPSFRYNFVETAEKRNFTTLSHFVFGGHDLDKFITSNGPSYWWGPMAINHGDSSTLGFCDGHAERNKWQSQETFDRMDYTGWGGKPDTSGPSSDEDVDVAYMAKGWPYQAR